MKKFKRMKNLISRMASLALAFALLIGAFPFVSTPASAATYSWPEFSSSSYAEYVAPANTSSLYQDYAMTVRGTLSPKKSYNSSISQGDCLMLMGFTADKAGIVVSYPVGQTRRIAIVPTKTLLGTSAPAEAFNAKASVPVYKITNTVAKWGSIAAGDMLYRAGSVTYNGCKYYLFVYEAAAANRAWKIGFLTASDYEKVKGNASTQGESTNATTSAVTARLNKIINGELRYNDKTVMQLGKRFTGTRCDEECKGLARNTTLLLFNKMIGSTQPRSKGLNYLLYESKDDGIYKVGSITEMTPENVSALFSQCKPGFMVQLRRSSGGSHSAVVYQVNSDSVSFYECNVDGRNTVSLNTYTWAEICLKNSAMSIYAPDNYVLK